ncbi:alpha/beta hydrolase [Candidatus Saccharibacteria bacterium]|nr:alpha/beta hydrolase [Candidatus Saccharibacteria bacterium]
MKKLYIIHGWTYTTEPWNHTLKILKAKGVQVKMLHVPGLTDPSKKVWTISDYVHWAEAELPDGAVALGHSNGGRILLNLCTQYPKKLSHLILLDSAGVYEESKKRNIARKLSKTLSPLKKIKPLRKVVHKLLGASDYDHAPANMKQTLANMLDSDKNLDITKVTVPTTILWGKADSVTPPHQAKLIHQQIKDSKLTLKENWTHSPYISHPKELADAIYQTLKGLE